MWTKESYPDTQIIEELEGRGYCNILPIGKGGFSKVLRVWDGKRNRFLACKISVIGEMAEREAQTLRGLQHPLFPGYVDSWKAGDNHYLIMEYVCGSNLRELQANRGHFTQRQAVSIAMELAQGLIFLHERSEPFLFRDIKPDNVMIRQDGRVKLVDVGCVRRLQESGNIAGSRGYSAPEQFCAEGRPGVESDIYALGKLLYYMLTGDNTEENRRNSEEVHYKGKVYYKGISRGLIRLVEQATEEKQQMRIPDMRTFLQQLSIYSAKKSLKSCCEDIKACMSGKGAVQYYYIQNARKGMDKWQKMC